MSEKPVYFQVEQVGVDLGTFSVRLKLENPTDIDEMFSKIYKGVVNNLDPLIRRSPQLQENYKAFLAACEVYKKDPPRKVLSRKVGMGWQACITIEENLSPILNSLKKDFDPGEKEKKAHYVGRTLRDILNVDNELLDQINQNEKPFYLKNNLEYISDVIQLSVKGEDEIVMNEATRLNIHITSMISKLSKYVLNKSPEVDEVDRGKLLEITSQIRKFVDYYKSYLDGRTPKLVIAQQEPVAETSVMITPRTDPLEKILNLVYQVQSVTAPKGEKGEKVSLEKFKHVRGPLYNLVDELQAPSVYEELKSPADSLINIKQSLERKYFGRLEDELEPLDYNLMQEPLEEIKRVAPNIAERMRRRMEERN